ncbi:MAG: DUF192 domain-containing protein [Caldilineaceae bacterium]|nr:DUF192 domain-containing protein [Caldilineaceae bacterium]
MLYVENLTRNHVLVRQGRVANNFWTKFRGLMGVRQLPAGAGLLIEPCDSIHTHFMRMPIDVLYVNAQHCIVGIDAALQPWRIGRKRAEAAYVLELPSGTAQRTQSAVGDQLKLSLAQ